METLIEHGHYPDPRQKNWNPPKNLTCNRKSLLSGRRNTQLLAGRSVVHSRDSFSPPNGTFGMFPIRNTNPKDVVRA